MKCRSIEGVMQLCDTVRQTGFELRKYLGHGQLEKVYENGLAHRLRKRGLHVEQQMPVVVRDKDGTILGDYVADLLVEGVLIVELKACKALAEEHTAQILGYLRGSRIEHGLLMNFGGWKYEVRKYVLSDA